MAKDFEETVVEEYQTQIGKPIFPPLLAAILAAHRKEIERVIGEPGIPDNPNAGEDGGGEVEDIGIIAINANRLRQLKEAGFSHHLTKNNNEEMK